MSFDVSREMPAVSGQVAVRGDQDRLHKPSAGDHISRVSHGGPAVVASASGLFREIERQFERSAV